MKNTLLSLLLFLFLPRTPLPLLSTPSNPPVYPVISENHRIERLYDPPSNTWYLITEIKNRDKAGNLIRLRHSHSSKPEGEFTTAFAEKTGSRLAFNASTARETGKLPDGRKIIEPTGIQIIDRQIISETAAKNRFVLGIKANNRLIAYPPLTTAHEMLADGAIDALNAFTLLIDNHRPVSDETLQIGPPNYWAKHPRQVIAQMENLDLVFLSCGGRGFDGEGMTSHDLIRILMNHGVKFACMLDGGGSVSTVVNGHLITPKIDGKGTRERRRPNFLHIAPD